MAEVEFELTASSSTCQRTAINSPDPSSALPPIPDSLASATSSTSAVMSLLLSITHNIPWFLREPAEAIIGEVCYSTLIYDLNLLDPTCLRHSLSKVLGLGIVVGGSIVKLPQIHTLLRTRSAHGLSLPAYALETLGYAISLAYAWRSGFPFSTYGENVFMALQGVAIVLLVVKYGGTGGRRGSGVWGLAMALVGWVLLDHRVVSFSTLKFLQACTVPISLLSKAPQILSNHRLKSTGNLSSFAVFNALLGCLARIFTTLTEVDDPLVMWGFLLAALLNAVIAGQMILYWNNSSVHSHALPGSEKGGASLSNPLSRRTSSNAGKEERGVGMIPGSPTAEMLGGAGTKRWNTTGRKVD